MSELEWIVGRSGEGGASAGDGDVFKGGHVSPNEQQATQYTGMLAEKPVSERQVSEPDPFRPPHLVTTEISGASTTEMQAQPEPQAPERLSGTTTINDYEKLNERYRHLHSQRGKTIATRIDVISQRAALQQNIPGLEKARDELSQRLRSFVPENPSSEDIGTLLAAINNVQQQQEDVSFGMEQVKKLELQLNSLEYDLGKEEVGFFGTLRTMVPALIKAAEEAPTLSLSSGVDTHEDELLKAYYDLASDIPILEERIAELEHTFGEERAERETRTNLGEPISPPDLDFYSQYNQDKEALNRELDLKRDEVARLQSRCIQQGLLPKPSNAPSVMEEEVNKPASEGGAGLEEPSHPDGHGLAIQDLPSLDSRRTIIDDWFAGSPIATSPVDEGLGLGASEPGSAPGSESATLPYGFSPRATSLSESGQDVEDDVQLGQKRNISGSNLVSRVSSSKEEPPQKLPKST